MKKNLIQFAEDIEQNDDGDFLRTELTEDREYYRVEELLRELRESREYKIEEVVRLYEHGVTYVELGERYGRHMQSIARSVKHFGQEGSVQENHRNRKQWYRLMNKYYFVYLADKSGGYRWLMETYGVDRRKAKRIYRDAGGEKLCKETAATYHRENRDIEKLVKAGHTGYKAAGELGMSPATVYYRLHRVIRYAPQRV